jgi:1-hydroxy-2-isopentenylcarotenoid 3,4-desaturase
VTAGSARPASQRAVVIGGGIAGLATAALLGREGYAVTLLEARDDLGGRVGTWQHGDFRFDTGPSWYLMPEVFEHFFRLLGTTSAEQLDLVNLDPGYRVFFQKYRDPVDIAASAEANLDTFERIESGAREAMTGYLRSARDAYQIARDRFLYNTFASYRSMCSPSVLKRAGRLLRLVIQPLDRFVAGFVSDPRLRQVLGYPAVFLGSSPYATPSMYHLMSHLDLEAGVLYPRGGFGSIIESIERLALAENVQIVTGARVTAITSDGTGAPQVTGVDYLDSWGVSNSHQAEIVVSTADLHHTETELVPADARSYPERWWRRRVAGPGAVLIMLGVRGELPELAHHTLFFTEDWRKNFARIFTAPTSIPRPASLYVCRPSATDAGVAPAGSENLFVLIPVPADPSIGAGGFDGDGGALVEQAADDAIRQIGEWARIPDLAERIVVRKTIGPGDFVSEFSSWQGSALGPAHTLRQSAFLRGKNISSRLGGLLYAGASTVPGIGLPMCLISAELVIKRLRGDTTPGALPEPL